MFTYDDLKDYFKEQDFQLIIAADAETRTAKRKNGEIVSKIPAGGVAIALDPIARASNALYIGRGKPEEGEVFQNKTTKATIEDPSGNYQLKRLFFSEEDLYNYYYGFSNQTLWPLCHVAFEQPDFKKDWYEGFKRVNQKFAKAIEEELKRKNFIWVNDYQLSLVPKYLGKPKGTTIGMFWHIPWPTWEVFRILPYKHELLESLLLCDFLAFHRGYHVRNFLETVGREFEARIDQETNRVYYKGNVTTVENLPMGIDVDVIASLAAPLQKQTLLEKVAKSLLSLQNGNNTKKDPIMDLFDTYSVILGVDRLDYTKGLLLRFRALDWFFAKNPKYIGKVKYLGVIAPSREPIPSYQKLKKNVRDLASEINEKYSSASWRPIEIFYNVLPREQLMRLYQRSDVCLVTPRDDGMNLVSKEFVLAASLAENPGMLVLSKFAGSAIDLTQALIINPYNPEEVAGAIKKALEMDTKEKEKRMKSMAKVLEERNVYEWAKEFIEKASEASRR